LGEQEYTSGETTKDAVINRHLTALAQSNKPPGVAQGIKITTALRAQLRYL
jgi:hypothetical protein